MTVRQVVVLVLEMSDDQARQSPPTVWNWAQIVGPELATYRVLPIEGRPLRVHIHGRNITEEPAP